MISQKYMQSSNLACCTGPLFLRFPTSVTANIPVWILDDSSRNLMIRIVIHSSLLNHVLPVLALGAATRRCPFVHDFAEGKTDLHRPSTQMSGTANGPCTGSFGDTAYTVLGGKYFLSLSSIFVDHNVISFCGVASLSYAQIICLSGGSLVVGSSSRCSDDCFLVIVHILTLTANLSSPWKCSAYLTCVPTCTLLYIRFLSLSRCVSCLPHGFRYSPACTPTFQSRSSPADIRNIFTLHSQARPSWSCRLR